MYCLDDRFWWYINFVNVFFLWFFNINFYLILNYFSGELCNKFINKNICFFLFVGLVIYSLVYLFNILFFYLL